MSSVKSTKHPGGRPTSLTPELLDKAYDYIFVSEEYGGAAWAQGEESADAIPTIEGFALFLGLSRDTIYAWEKINEEFSYIVDRIRTEQAQTLINGSLKGKLNPTIAKLILSGKHGYIEKSDQSGEQKIIVETRHAHNDN